MDEGGATVETKLQRITSLLVEHRGDLERLGVETLALFGSAVRGEERPDSDLDFVVLFRGAATYARYTDLLFLPERLLGRSIDLVTWKGVRPEIRERVEREAVRVA